MQIASIRELRPVAFVRLYVVHVRGPGTDSTLGAFPAKRLLQELRWPQIIQPFRRQVHPVPGLGLGAAAVFWLMGCAVSIRHQDAASRMPARPERLLCHRAITSGQNKKRPSHRHPSSGLVSWLRRWSLRTLAQALRYSRYSPAHTACTVEADCERWCPD